MLEDELKKKEDILPRILSYKNRNLEVNMEILEFKRLYSE